MTSLIPIGRFSKMTPLSVKALRLYDEMLLLVPAHVDSSTGYRYYTPSQVRRAVIIGALHTSKCSRSLMPTSATSQV